MRNQGNASGAMALKVRIVRSKLSFVAANAELIPTGGGALAKDS
jgi:hypothetical protein